MVSASELSHAQSHSAAVINYCVLFCYFALLHASSLICRYGIVVIPVISQRLWLPCLVVVHKGPISPR